MIVFYNFNHQSYEQIQSLFQNVYHMHENVWIMGIFYIVKDST